MEIYIHIPFCVKKCAYCDFFSGAYPSEIQERYFDEMKEEIVSSPFGGGTVSSVFFGGGTPSSVAPEKIDGILTLLRREFNIAPDAEISLEANPGTLTSEKLYVYRQAGINRLSIGLQSPDNEMLKRIGRIHSFEDFLESYTLARTAGFRNINIDLISGLPLETAAGFEKKLRKVTALKPEHLSVYSLIIEENTPFFELYGENEDGTPKERAAELPDEDTDCEIYRLTGKVLEEAGLYRYEISNYARPGYECRHNIGYWTGEEYLGFGAAAASFADGKRFKNAERTDYFNYPYIETELLSEKDRMSEFMILGLRMTAGTAEKEFEKRFGKTVDSVFGEAIRKHLKYGTISRCGGQIALTGYGLDVANGVMADFLL